MKTSFQIGSVGPLLTVKHRISHVPPLEHLAKLCQRSLLLTTYKHFFRLRHLVLDEHYQQEEYLRLLRRRYVRGDFNLRRKKVLGIEKALSNAELARRLSHTYTFVFNATCNVKDEPLPVQTYEDAKKANEPLLETQILSTIVKMELQTPNHIKFDLEYRWLDRARERETELALGNIDKKRAKDLNRSREVVDIGFADYERAVMALNESLDLCL